MKKRIIAALLASTLAFSITACGKTDTKDKTSSEPTKQASELSLYTYYADASIERVDRILESMKKIYPDLTINIEHRTDSDGSVLKTRAAVGELPDIFECTGQLTDILIKSNDLAQLDDVIEKTNLFDKFLDGAFDSKKDKDGHYYAVQPEAPEVCLMFYNIEVFEKLGITPPKNYDELKTTIKTLSENNLIPLSLFAQQKWPGLQMYDMAVVGEGQTLGLSGLEDGTTKITDEAYVNAAKKLTELVKLGLIGKGALNTNASQAFELLETGKAGLLVNGA